METGSMGVIELLPFSMFKHLHNFNNKIEALCNEHRVKVER